MQLKNESSLLIFGRGVNYATALEAALKVLNSTQLNTLNICLQVLHQPLLASRATMMLPPRYVTVEALAKKAKLCTNCLQPPHSHDKRHNGMYSRTRLSPGDKWVADFSPAWAASEKAA